MHLAYFIDVLRGRERLKVHPKVAQAVIADLIERARMAEPFSFGKLPLEQSSTGYRVPKLTPGECEMYRSRILPWPAPVCWFEFSLETPSAILIDTRDPELWTFERFDFGGTDKPNQQLPIAMVVAVAPSQIDGAEPVAIGSSDPFVNDLLKHFDGRNELTDLFGAMPYIAMYMNLMIYSKSTELVKVTPADKLNKARVKRGATALPAHRVVRIVPYRFIDFGEVKDAHGNVRRAPRTHWRRSHIRHFDKPTETSVWAPDHAWHGKTGWHCVPIPRFLVAKKADAEVTHEYEL